MGNRCSIGKSCGATCIDRQENCIIEFGPEVAATLTRVRDFLLKAKTETVRDYQPLDTPQKAAEWLLKNKDEMASWGFTQEKLDDIISKKPAMVTFGVEPGVGPAVVKHLEDMKNEVPALKNMSPVRDSKAGTNGPWGDQMLKANSYKLAQEASKVLHKLNPEDFPKQLSEAGKQLAAAGMNVDVAMKYLYLLGMVKGDKIEGFMDYDRAAQSAAAKKNILWETAVGLIQRGAGLQGGGVYGANPSGLWKPSQQFGQFKELFKNAGMEDQMGPFESNAKWYKYSSQTLGDKVMKMTREAKPKLVYFGGKEADKIRERIRDEYQKNGTFGLRSSTKAGQPVEKQFEFFIYQHPNGQRTVSVFGPHAGALGFKSNRNLMEAVGETAKSLIENGVIPQTIKSAELIDVSPVKSAGPRNIAPVSKGERERQVKQTAKELRAEAKPAKAQVDKGKQVAAYRNIAEGLKKQGFGAVRIREELRKMGVPPALINEIV